MQKTREFAALVSLLSKRNLGAVVEIGSLQGGTLWAWCQLARRDAVIVCVDLPGGPFSGGYDINSNERLENYARAEQSVILIRDDSHLQTTREKVADALGGRAADLLFIDGDHSYVGVKKDFEMYTPLVRDGGVIALHDILPHPATRDCEVDLFWKELRAGGNHVEFTDPADVRGRGQWGGIGVVFAPTCQRAGTDASTLTRRPSAQGK